MQPIFFSNVELRKRRSNFPFKLLFSYGEIKIMRIGFLFSLRMRIIRQFKNAPQKKCNDNTINYRYGTNSSFTVGSRQAKTGLRRKKTRNEGESFFRATRLKNVRRRSFDLIGCDDVLTLARVESWLPHLPRLVVVSRII